MLDGYNSISFSSSNQVEGTPLLERAENTLKEVAKKIWTAGEAVGNLTSKSIQLLTNLKDRTVEYLEEYEANIDGTERYFFEGLAVSVISAIAAAYLFECGSARTGALYGAVGYGVFTGIAELTGPLYDRENLFKPIVITAGVSYLITNAFMKTVFKTPLTYQCSAILALATACGQVARELCYQRDTKR